MIAAANAKKKTTGKGKKGKEEPKPEEVEVKEVKKVKEERKELDLLKPEDFDQALKERAPRRFTFGPIEFGGLNQSNE